MIVAAFTYEERTTHVDSGPTSKCPYKVLQLLVLVLVLVLVVVVVVVVAKALKLSYIQQKTVE